MSSDPGSAEVPVTRIEVLDFVGEAFDHAPVKRAALMRTAARNGALGPVGADARCSRGLAATLNRCAA